LTGGKARAIRCRRNETVCLHPIEEAGKAELIAKDADASADEGLRAFAVGVPKAEVHVHLEGCFELEDIQELARTAGEPLPRPARELFRFHGMTDFLDFLTWQCGLIRTKEQLAEAAYRFAERESAAGVVYADLIVNPNHWSGWTDRVEAFIEALDDGLARAEGDGLTPVGLCISLLRQQSAPSANELVTRVIAMHHPRVVALSIDGNEEAVGRTSERFASAFARARSAGLHATVHAGESSGPQGIRDAIDLLGAERIDHGFRAVEEPPLVTEIAERGIPLNLCPWSNIELGHFPDRRSHPLEALRLASVRVSINTDDPALFGVTLDGEYVAMAETYGWNREVIADVSRSSIEASFCDDARKRVLLEQHAAWVRDRGTASTGSSTGIP
jgi:adenosine deaminase